MERKKMSSDTVLKASDLNKSFSGIVAAKDINVSINQGEIVGIIGANGAGKTVFVNMITGYLKPTSGSVEFLGQDITGIEPRDATHIGLCRSFQISQVFMTMSVKQNLMIAMSLSKKSGKALLDPIDDEKISKECDSILELYKIKDQSDNIVSTLSQGIRKLLDIAMAVVGNP
jgi:branched-chain amino acid transport system ATP-binding protein